MEKITVEALCYMHQELMKVKNPSARIKASLEKLEDALCQLIESMAAVGLIRPKNEPSN